MDINTKIPSRGRYFELGETDPSPYIRDAIIELHKRGADFVVIPCNTAHILYSNFAKKESFLISSNHYGGDDGIICVPNIIDVTAVAVNKMGFSNSMILCTNSSRKNRIYEDVFDRFGINCFQFPDQVLISKSIEAVKQNKDVSNIANSVYDILVV